MSSQAGSELGSPICKAPATPTTPGSKPLIINDEGSNSMLSPAQNENDGQTHKVNA